MSISARKKPDIDVMENVFGGVRISVGDDVKATADADIRPRPWLAGLEIGRARVTLAEDDGVDESSRKR